MPDIQQSFATAPAVITPDPAHPSIAVIGAGITGVTTAYNLAKRGCRVTLFDAHPYAAMETSFANGGQLSASNAEVWNSWATVFKGLKWMFKPGAPLLVNPKPSWHKLSWMAEFVAAIPHHEENTVTTVRLAIEARAHLQRMAEEAGIDFDLEERGILHFYKTKDDFDGAAHVTALLAKGGLERRAVDAGGDAGHRAGATRRTLWRLVHAVRLHRRHPQVHRGPGSRLRAAGRRHAALHPRLRRAARR